MCGIIGVTGTADALKILTGGLRLLEYRGYDSAGVALLPSEVKGGADPVTGGRAIWRERAAVRAQSITSLEASAASAPASDCGIGHTR
ncbi:MAG: glutamine--fructose-6-phosphate transaminase (isomerizing), partial [Acidimicrobiales bacterium]